MFTSYTNLFHWFKLFLFYNFVQNSKQALCKEIADTKDVIVSSWISSEWDCSWNHVEALLGDNIYDNSPFLNGVSTLDGSIWKQRVFKGNQTQSNRYRFLMKFPEKTPEMH